MSLSEVAPFCGASPGRIAVHAHVFYPELAREIASSLALMPFSYDLYVSVVNGEAARRCERLFGKTGRLAALDVRIVENRGRDIAPLVCTFGRELRQYDYVCHLHTKKSLYNAGATMGWREYLYQQLFGSEDHIRRIFAIFARDERVGLVYPQNFSDLPYVANTWLANRGCAQHWSRRLGVGSLPRGYFDYPAGSMFWARPKALDPLFSDAIRLADFPEESGQTDGTLAHCLERLVGVLPEARGFRNVILADPCSTSWSPWRVDQYLARGGLGSNAMLESADTRVVAFDIFDTLLLRPLVDPEDTKRVVAELLCDPEYPRLRAEAEHVARERRGRDVGLEQIYHAYRTLSGRDNDGVRRAHDAERDTEISLVHARPEGVALLRQALASGKRVVLVSDTFLERRHIESMLSRVGIRDYHALYISSETGLRKDSGELYRHVLRAEQLSPSSLLMVGDNERSDWQIPTDMGMRTLHVMRPVELARSLRRWRPFIEQAERSPSIHERVVIGMLAARRFRAVDPDDVVADAFVSSDLKEVGYIVAGPILVAFAEWLLERARHEGDRALFFLAREGEILKEVYEKIAARRETAPAARYLVVSRRAVSVPLLNCYDDIRTVTRTNYFGGPVGKFIAVRFGLDPGSADVEEIFERHGIAPGQPLKITDSNDSAVRPILKDLAPSILEIARRERAAFGRYLQESGLADATSAAVVDIGYGGSIQEGLSRLLGRSLGGYYLVSTALAHSRATSRGNRAYGCFAEAIDPAACGNAMWQQSFVLEMLLSSDGAQVTHYTVEGGKAVPVFAPRDSQEVESQCSRRRIREGAMAFVEDYLALRSGAIPGLVVTPDVANRIFEEFVRGMAEAERIGLRGLVLDDHYCGRGVVSLEQHLEFMRGVACS